MLEDWLDVLGCPSCRSPLLLTDDATLPLHCRACGERFALDGRIPGLLRGEDAGRLARFSRQYREARLAEGWQPLTAEQARALPYGQPSGYPSLYWEVRRQSFCALMSLLAREGPSPAAGPIADLGTDSGWLSYRLAQAGYRVLAIEASRDAAFGLGAAEAHDTSEVPFLLVQGDLERPPLQPGRLGMLPFNASLHYAADLENTLRRAAQALQPHGRLIILETPIARQPHPGTGHGDRHLGRQLKVWLDRQPRFSFPVSSADPT